MADIREQSQIPQTSVIPTTPLIPGSSIIPTESVLTPRPVQPQEMQREAPLGFLTTPKTQPQQFSSAVTPVPKQYERAIQEAARIANLPVTVVQGLLNQENKFHPTGQSPTGAKGIAQLTSGFIKDIGKNNNPYTPDGRPLQVDPWNPESALKALGYYLRFANKKHGGDLRRTITSYNAGPWYKRPKNKEQAEYFDRVMSYARGYGYKEGGK